jgi:hypothetical protein
VPNSALRFRPSAETFALLGVPAVPVAPDRVPAAGVHADAVRAADHSGSDAPVAAVSRSDAPRPTPVEASTVDALFGPLAPVTTTGRVWVRRDGRIVPVTVRLGLSDGQTSVLLDGDLQPGDELVTSVTAADASVRTTAQPAGGLFMPTGGGRFGRVG